MEEKLKWLRTYGADESFLDKTWATYAVDQENWAPVERVKAWKLGAPVGLYLHGPPGSGKSHALKAMLNQFVDWKMALAEDGRSSPLRAFWVSMSFYLDRLRADKTEAKDKALRAPILFLDDLGASTQTDWAQDQVFQLLDHRADRSLQTLITSNLTVDEIGQHYNERISSRLRQLCIPVAMTGRDRRIDVAKKNLKMISTATRGTPGSEK